MTINEKQDVKWSEHMEAGRKWARSFERPTYKPTEAWVEATARVYAETHCSPDEKRAHFLAAKAVRDAEFCS